MELSKKGKAKAKRSLPRVLGRKVVIGNMIIFLQLLQELNGQSKVA
jgi:hypothetical protein